MSRSQRSKITAHPPRPGVYATEIVRFLQRDPLHSWPAHLVLERLQLTDRMGWSALARLLELGLIERRSEDSIIRVILTPRGRRYRAHGRPGNS